MFLHLYFVAILSLTWAQEQFFQSTANSPGIYFDPIECFNTQKELIYSRNPTCRLITSSIRAITKRGLYSAANSRCLCTALSPDWLKAFSTQEVGKNGGIERLSRWNVLGMQSWTAVKLNNRRTPRTAQRDLCRRLAI
ncbi:unnamed protein product, partial [Iphiclides podalirius]